MNAPLILFVYNRPQHTQATLEALRSNEGVANTPLYIYSDYARYVDDIPKVEATREIIRKVDFFQSVHLIERTENWGLARNVIAGVSEVLASYGKAIVLEDDLLTSPFFLTYMNQMLDVYQDEAKVFSISAYQFPAEDFTPPADYPYDIYFTRRSSSWGWATWIDRWQSIDWKMSDYPQFRRSLSQRRQFALGGDDMPDMLDRQMKGKIDSWAIRYCYSQFKQNRLAVYPVESYIINKGLDGSGTHGATEKARAEVVNLKAAGLKLPPSPELNPEMDANFARQYAYSFKTKVLNLIKKSIRYEQWKR